MRDEILNGFEIERRRLRAVLQGVPSSRWADQPGGLVHHAAWTVGHLAVSMEAIGGELGLAPWLDDAWRARHGQGSSPVPARIVYPESPILLDMFDGGADRVVAAVRGLGDEGWRGPLPDERHRATYPTLAHAVLHVLVGHTAFHVGQLVAWARARQDERRLQP
ncbi:MAG: DinB family protein [Planctomycetota bacterium]|nr:DinB family protein [Planctomycetota bacterium]MCB9901521.1 DinB family protein [Planctomycetota bacterium]